MCDILLDSLFFCIILTSHKCYERQVDSCAVACISKFLKNNITLRNSNFKTAEKKIIKLKEIS